MSSVPATEARRALIRRWRHRLFEPKGDGIPIVGRQIRKVPIDIEALVAWWRERKCRIDAAARAEYVSCLLGQAERVGERSR